MTVLVEKVTGIYRAMSVRVGQTQRTMKSVFKVEVRAISPKVVVIDIS